MKNLLLRKPRGLFRIFIYLVFPIFTLCFQSTTGKSQTLFEIAITLDSLADSIKVDQAFAKPFFDELHKVYGYDDDFEPKNMRDDVRHNRYLKEIVNVAYTQFKELDGINDSLITSLYDQKDSLLDIAGTLVYENCDECWYSDEISRFNRYGSYEDLVELISKIDDNPNLEKELGLIKKRIWKLKLKISENEDTSETTSKFFQSDQASSMMLSSSSPTLNTMPPLIIQQQGGGSAQSAVIDGTAKWIAERMRQELSIAFFDRFQSWAEGKNINTLFPNTLSVLSSSATTDYTLMIKIYKQAFEKDLKKLTFNLPDFLKGELVDQNSLDSLLIDWSLNKSRSKLLTKSFYTNLVKRNEYVDFLDKITEGIAFDKENGASDEVIMKLELEKERIKEVLNKFDKKSDKRAKETSPANYLILQDYRDANQTLKYINFALVAIEKLSEGNHPSVLLSYLNEHADQLFIHNSDLKSTLMLLDVLSQSLIKVDADKNTVWISQKEIKRLKEDGQFRSIYFGLIYHKIKQVYLAKENYWKEKRNSAMWKDSSLLLFESNLKDLTSHEQELSRAFISFAKYPVADNYFNEVQGVARWEEIVNNFLSYNKYEYSYYGENLDDYDFEYNEEGDKEYLYYLIYELENEIRKGRFLDSDFLKAYEFSDSLRAVAANEYLSTKDNFYNAIFNLFLKDKEYYYSNLYKLCKQLEEIPLEKINVDSISKTPIILELHAATRASLKEAYDSSYHHMDSLYRLFIIQKMDQYTKYNKGECERILDSYAKKVGERYDEVIIDTKRIDKEVEWNIRNRTLAKINAELSFLAHEKRKIVGTYFT